MKKEVAIVSFLWQQFNHVIFQLLREYPGVTILTLRRLVTDEYVTSLEKLGGRVVLFDFPENTVPSPEALETQRDVLSLIREPSITLKAEAHRSGDVKSALEKTFSSEYLPATALIDLLDRALEEFDIRALVQNEDVMTQGKTAALWARSRKIPSLQVSHAIPLQSLYTVHGILHSDYVAVYGLRGAEPWEDKGIDAHRVCVTGNPAWDDYARLSDAKSAIRNSLISSYKLDPAAPIVVFAPTWFANLSATLDPECYARSLSAFLRAVEAIKQKGSNLNAIIKERATGLHGISHFKSLCRTIGVDPAQYIFNADAAKPWVIAADVIVAMNSNILVEALIAGTPAINILTDDALRNDTCFDAQSGIIEATPALLPVELERLLTDQAHRARVNELLRNAAPRYNTGVDGEASSRVAALIATLGRLSTIRNASTKTGNTLKLSLGAFRLTYPAKDLGIPGESTTTPPYPHTPRLDVLALLEREPRTVLDVGCSSGATLTWIKERFPHCRTIGIESNPRSAEIAKQHVDLLIQKSIDDIDWRTYGINDGSVDTIIFADVIEHLDAPWKTLYALRDLLSPEGRILASIPNARNLWLLDHLASGCWTYADEGLLDATHLRFFTKLEIQRLFERSGYTIRAARRNIDYRLEKVANASDTRLVQTENIIVGVRSQEDLQDLATMQFVVAASREDDEVFRQKQKSGVFLQRLEQPSLDLLSDVGGFVNAGNQKQVLPPRTPRIGVLTGETRQGAAFNLRIGHIFDMLSKHVETRHVAYRNSDGKTQINNDAIAGCDAFLVLRTLPSDSHAALLDKLRATKKPIIFDTEAQIESEQYPGHADYVQDLLKDAQLVVLNTPALAQRHQAAGSTVTCFLEHIPRTLWEPAAKQQQRQSVLHEQILIGISTGNGEDGNLATIEKVLPRIADEYGDRVKIVIWGPMTTKLGTIENLISLTDDAPYQLYPQQLASLGLDIALIPLENTHLNHQTSDLKWLEYSALGIASLVSDAPPFKQARDLELTLAVPNDANAWFEALTRLIEDQTYRIALGRRAQQHVFTHRTLEDNVLKYASILNSILPATAQIPTGETLQLSPLRLMHRDEIAIPSENYGAWSQRTRIREVDAEVLAERMMAWPMQPQVTLLSIVRKADLSQLAQCTDALKNQFYENWRFIVISDQPSPDPVFGSVDFLVWNQVDSLDDCGSVAALTNQLLEQGDSDVFSLLLPGTRLEPQALILALDCFMSDPQTTAVYPDHDYYDQNGNHRPQFKPSFDLEWLRSRDYIGPTVFFKTSDILALGGVHPYPNAAEYDLLLRLSEHPEVHIVHLPGVLASLPLREYPDNSFAHQVALEQQCIRTKSAMNIQPGLIEGSFHLEPIVEAKPKVSIIIVTKDAFPLIATCLTSLFAKTDYPDFEVIVVDNLSADPDVHSLYERLRGNGLRLKIVSDDGPYSPARLFNYGAANADGEVLVFAQADCEFTDPEWLERLALQTLNADGGIAGPLLLQPYIGRVESAGLFLGSGELFATTRPALNGNAVEDCGYMGMQHTQRTVSAVASTGLTVRQEIFRTLGGFDESFPLSEFNVDFCLRAAIQGWKSIYTPYSRIIHHRDAVMASQIDTPEALYGPQHNIRQEQVRCLKKWYQQIGNDPYANPNLSMADAEILLESEIPLSWRAGQPGRARVIGLPFEKEASEYRVARPLARLAKEGIIQAETPPPGSNHLPSVSEILRLSPQCIFVHQRIDKQLADTLEAWKELLPEVRIVYGLDETLEMQTFSSTMSQRTNLDRRSKLRRILELSDAVVVSTQAQAELTHEICAKAHVHVIPDSLDRETWEELSPTRRTWTKPRVGWIEVKHSSRKLELILPVLEATHREVDWVIMGEWRPEFEGLVKEKHAWVDSDTYPKALSGLELDLVIAPLESTGLNQQQTNRHLLECGALGYPVLCSDSLPYRIDSPPVQYVPNDPVHWITAILDKVRDSDALKHEGAALKEWVMSHYLLEQHVLAWKELLLGN